MTATARRSELGSFLRSRRERVTPGQVGMPPGLRRRTPGLRREEVAQLAGVGVTWYTWLEQGRPINASAQVLAAVARTLRLSDAERDHLYRLAGVPQLRSGVEPAPGIPDELHAILRALDPLPAVLVNARTDVLAWNRSYGAVHHHMVSASAAERNTLWYLFTAPPEHSRILNRDEQAPEVVAGFRYRYSQHPDDPQWRDLVARLHDASPLFARLWDTEDVAPPSLCDKHYDFPEIGELRLRSTGMDLIGRPGIRLVVHTPADDCSRDRLDRLRTRPVDG
ncbi:helix-turn-helix transcriptional regulator [Winogradskya consettensis]|uniref:Transcriptional regulator n=1 Tax=Winogradskya consettensis TaxID=113560 RepID=A0A919SNS6_9ACTN|nr:helix-turn-helix transcriptional regulator [Actinoplanes consettensis]GIM75545.1 transcriptional regulator [Actinoplanes consettensis]